MPRHKRVVDPAVLPTIWRVSDDLWQRIQRILDQDDPPKHRGRKRIDPRRALDGIIDRMRSGVQWNQLLKKFGDDSSVHRTFQRWVRLAIFDKIWAEIQNACDELGGVNWECQAADALLGKARLGGT